MKKHKIIFILLTFCLIKLLLFTVSCQSCSSGHADNFHKDSIQDSLLIKNNDSIKDTICKKYLLGKILPEKDTNFILADIKFSSRKGHYLHKEAYTAFNKMYVAALKDGITLIILSATRTFKEQQAIWEKKWNGKLLQNGKNAAKTFPKATDRANYILHYSSMPGTSRHHWGTDIDLNSMELSYFKTDSGKKMYNWLTKNASTYGYSQPYNSKDSLRSNGYEEEKWHWSYLPIAAKYLKQYKKQISYNDIIGFSGWEEAEKLDVINNYVMAVNKNCQ